MNIVYMYKQQIFFLDYNNKLISLLKMGRKNSSNVSEPMSEEDQVTIEEQVQKAIKDLPTLEEKIQAIAINGYLIEKRQVDKKLESQINKIEVNDRKLYEQYLTEIYNIVSGNVELTDADFQGVVDLLTDQQNESKHNYYPKKQLEEYWLRVLQSSEETGQTIQPDDDAVLKHLKNITASKTEDGKNLTITFFFTENEWFTNQSIKKQFELDGDTIKRSYGDAIQWKQGKNLTVEIVKKKNKKKKTTTTKKIKKQSFFNIFNQVDLSSDNDEKSEQAADEQDDKQVQQLEKQYEVCNAIYEQLLPRSLEHYLGLASFGDMGMDGLEGIQEVDDDEEEQKPAAKKNKKKRKGSQSSKE